ncbi:potassium-transporting ATPase subunit C [Metaclostridioides mangenotii]|uniref:potassium-transporting ATPase subunit C n=1 Tax=Metaclostridioides mangenotii TaxID=1540 RepID=UPI0028E19142|nr:potassium-transporting ATPase subunit C [Clostridioides mangenotii]
MKKVYEILRPAVMCFFIMAVICGIIYTTAVTGVAQVLFPQQANGSIVKVTLKDGTKKDYGSELIAQEFTKREYLIGRPMGTTNLSPVSDEQKNIVKNRIKWWHEFDPNNKKEIPIDLITASGSGVDPNITLQAAKFQVSRISKERGLSEDKVRETIDKYTTRRLLGFLGEPSVNVLKVNLSLDDLI